MANHALRRMQTMAYPRKSRDNNGHWPVTHRRHQYQPTEIGRVLAIPAVGTHTQKFGEVPNATRHHSTTKSMP